MADPEATGWPPAIDAITLFVDDLGAAKAWYAAFFSRPAIFEDPNSVVFALGDAVVNLLHVSAAPELIEPAVTTPPAVGSGVVFTLAVDDVDAMAAELVRRGAAI